MQLALGAQIHLHPQRVFDIELQADDAEQRSARGKVHEQVEVAALVVETVHDGPEHANVARAARGGDGEHPFAMGRKEA